MSKEAKPKAKRTVKGFYFCGWLGGGGGGGVGGWKEARGVVASLLYPTRIRMDVILISRSSVWHVSLFWRRYHGILFLSLSLPPSPSLSLPPSLSPSHPPLSLSVSILTPDQPVPEMTLYHQAPGRIATGVLFFFFFLCHWHDSTWKNPRGIIGKQTQGLPLLRRTL